MDKGALLLEMLNGLSKSAGLQPGDVIVVIDDNEISGMDDLRRRIMRGRIGDKIQIGHHRDQDTLEAYIELIQAPQ
ncbi:MAG: PDZ domain-containing protein [Candidatus Thorarchaeota archaeon]